MTGQDERIAVDVLNPETGLPGQSPRLSAYELNQWMSRWHSRPACGLDNGPKMLPEPPFEPPTEAEKERIAQVTRILKSTLRDATEAMSAPIGKKTVNPAPQFHSAFREITKEERDAKLLEALGNSGQAQPLTD